MDSRKIYLDEQGYSDLVQSLKDLEQKIKKVRLKKGTSAAETPTDSWHDNFAFEHAKNEEMMLLKLYSNRSAELSKIVVIDELSDKKMIGIGTSFIITFLDEHKKNEQIYKLVSGTKNLESGEASINSPLGRGVYGKKPGDKIEYSIKDKTIRALIKDIVKQGD